MSLRDAMPETAAFIAAVREAFGAEAVNPAIKKGMAGIPGHFHARENGHEAGTPFPPCGRAISLAEMAVGPLKRSGTGRK